MCIATLKYKQFVPQLIEGVKKYFMPNHSVTVFLFVDEIGEYEGNSRVAINQHLIPSYKFPFASLYRYKIFSNHERQLSKMDYLIYLDADMSIVSEVNDSLLVDEGLIAVRHPGFLKNNGWGDSNNPIESKSYLAKDQRIHYACGGTQGATVKEYLAACKVLAIAIDEDENNGVMPEWHDETMWNFYIHTSGVKVTWFTPEYCQPEQESLRKAWGIDDLPVKIIALAKDHKSIRE